MPMDSLVTEMEMATDTDLPTHLRRTHTPFLPSQAASTTDTTIVVAVADTATMAWVHTAQTNLMRTSMPTAQSATHLFLSTRPLQTIMIRCLPLRSWEGSRLYLKKRGKSIGCLRGGTRVDM